MKKASETHTLTAEDAAARCRELLTTAIPPPSGTSLKLRDNQPPSEIITRGTRPYQRRMWNPVDVDRWCRQRQPPRIRKALACLDRLEARLVAEASSTKMSVVKYLLAEILEGDGGEP